MQSQAYTLLTNAEPKEEVREALTPAVLADVDKALVVIRSENASALDLDRPTGKPDHRARIRIELGKFMRLAGGGWPPSQREEWIAGAEEELNDLPFELVVAAIERARKRVKFASEFVPWVIADIEPSVDRLKKEESMLSQLREIGRE